MAVDNFSEIREKIRIRTQDTAGTYWTDDELDLYINDGQLDFARRTRALRKQLPIVTKANDALYDFPDDFLEFIRMVTKDGEQVEPQSWKWLREQYGEDFMSATGATPEYLYADLDEKGKFRLYPTPVPTVDVDGTTFTPDFQIVAERSSFAALSCRFNGGIVHVSSSQVWYWHPDNGRSMVADVAAVALAANDQFIFAVTAAGELYRMNLGGIVNHDDMPAGTYATDRLMALHGAYAKYCVCAHGTKTYAVLVPDTGAITATELTFAGASRVFSAKASGCNHVGVSGSLCAFNIAADNKVYYDTMANVCDGGDITDTYATGSSATGLPLTVTMGNTIYRVKSSATGYSLYAGATEIIPEASFAASGCFSLTPSESDETVLYFSESPLAFGFKVYRMDIGEKAVTEVYDNTASPSASTGTVFNTVIDIGGELYADAVFGVSYCIAELSGEMGCMVYCDGAVFSGDIGIVTDVSEATDVTLFDDDGGGVVQFIDGQEALTLFYARDPQLDVVELDDMNPIIYYALWQCFMKENDQQNFGKSEVWMKMYEREVDRENRRRQQGFLGAVNAKRPANYTY